MGSLQVVSELVFLPACEVSWVMNMQSYFPHYIKSLLSSMRNFIFTLLLVLYIGRCSCYSGFSVIGYEPQDLVSNEALFWMYVRWQSELGKAYNGLSDKETRFHIFKNNLLYIDAQNKKTIRFCSASISLQTWPITTL